MGEVVGTAVVEIKADTSRVDRDLRRGFDKAGRDAGRAFGGSFKRNVAGFAGGLLAAGGIVGLSRTLINLGKDSLKAASDQSAANAIVERAVKNAGTEMTVFGKSIEDTLQSESLLKGFADDELAPAFVRLLRVTQDNEEAFKGLGLAQDLARQQGIAVSTAALAISRAYQGNVGSLGRYGIVLQGVTAETTKAEKATLALARIGEIAGGTALTFADSDAGKLERAARSFEEIKETLGQAILPTVGKIADGIADWFADPQNQQKVQRTVEGIAEGVSDTVQFVKDAGQGFGLIASVTTKIQDGIFRVVDLEAELNRGLQNRLGLRQSDNDLVKEQTAELLKQRDARVAAASAGGILAGRDRGRTSGFEGAGPIGGPGGFSGAPIGGILNRDLSRQIEEARAALSGSTADDLKLFRARQQNLQNQIRQVGDPRGKNDQARLIRLYEELGDISGEINDIEKDAADARADAAEERKRLAEEERERLKAEREEAAQRQREAREAAAQKVRDSKERARSLKESRLSLRLQQAELTKTTRDDKSALRAQIRFYNDQAKNFRRSGAQARAVESESKKVSAQLALQGLRRGNQSDSTAGAGAARTDFFQEAANQFRQFGSNIGRSGDALSGQQARGQFAGLALDRRRNTESLQTAQLNEQQRSNDILRQIATFLRNDTRASQGSLPPSRRPPNATDLARVNARNQLAGR